MKPLYSLSALVTAILLVVFPVFVFSGTGAGAPGKASPGTTSYTWKLASLAPKHVGWAKHIRQIIHPAVSRATEGRLKPQWYWGGIMGEDRDYIDKMKIGQLDGAAFTGQGVVLVLPEMSVLELPFMFKDYGEVDYVRKKMFPTFDALARKRGYIITAWADQDFDQIYSSRYPMARVGEFKKAKFLTWYGPVEQKVLARLGVRPIPMGVLEISPAMRQNMADTLIAPAAWMVGSQLYTTVKYVNPVKIRYSPVALLINLEAWNRLPAAHRDNLLAIRDKELKAFTQKSRLDSQRALAAMVKKAGVKKITMAEEELEKMRRLVTPVWYEMAGRDFSLALLEELLAHLEDYRSNRDR